MLLIYSATFKDEINQDTVRTLIKEVKGLNPTFQACDIRCKTTVPMYCSMLCECTHIAAGYTYYKTLTQDDSAKRRGVSEDRKKKRRQRERRLRVSLNL